MMALRADHEIDHARALEDLLSLGLRHAACDRDHGVEAARIPRPPHRAHPAKLGIDFLGGLLTDVAGVEYRVRQNRLSACSRNPLAPPPSHRTEF